VDFLTEPAVRVHADLRASESDCIDFKTLYRVKQRHVNVLATAVFLCTAVENEVLIFGLFWAVLTVKKILTMARYINDE